MTDHLARIAKVNELSEQKKLDEHSVLTDIPFPISRLPVVNVAMIPQLSPLRYPGGKTWLIPHIREWLSQVSPSILFEPFAGGGIVSLTAVMESFVKQAVMIEIDRDVAAFWHAVLRDGETMASRIRECQPTREMLISWEMTNPQCWREQGFRTLVLNRTRRGGILAKGASYMRDGENGRGLLSRWYPETLAQRVSKIAAYSDRITFVEGDGLRLMPLLLNGWGKRAAVFIDPPYTAGGKRAGTRLYRDSKIDHDALFAQLAKRQTNFLMTYDAAPEIITLVRKHGFCAVQVEMKNTHHRRLPELVITRERVFS